jgi:hypothetical protein
MMDANQVWDVGEAIEAMRVLGRFDPYWIEEPTSPDDVFGHAAIARAIAPIRVATGEHVHNRVMFKQLLQADAIGFCQIDSCRLGGVNEVLAVLLLAAKFGVPVCPHAGRPFRLPGGDAQRPLRPARGARLQRRDQGRVARPAPLPRRPRLHRPPKYLTLFEPRR